MHFRAGPWIRWLCFTQEFDVPTTVAVASSEFKSEIEDIYWMLGGILPSLPLDLRSWDLELSQLTRYSRSHRTIGNSCY